MTTPFRRGRQLLIALCLALGVAMSTSPVRAIQAKVTSSQAVVASLADLHDVGELKALFNRDVGKIRLVLLLSPT